MSEPSGNLRFWTGVFFPVHFFLKGTPVPSNKKGTKGTQGLVASLGDSPFWQNETPSKKRSLAGGPPAARDWAPAGTTPPLPGSARSRPDGELFSTWVCLLTRLGTARFFCLTDRKCVSEPKRPQRNPQSGWLSFGFPFRPTEKGCPQKKDTPTWLAETKHGKWFVDFSQTDLKGHQWSKPGQVA